MASMVSSRDPCAVIRMISVSGESGWMRVRRSMPLPSGSRRSMKTRSKGRARRSASASPALRAVSTLCPRSPRTSASASATLASSSTARILLPCDMAARLPLVRQPDPDGRPLAGAALDRHGPLVLLDHPLRVGHAEAEPLTLRREERLEDFFDLLLAHPTPLVVTHQATAPLSLL